MQTRKTRNSNGYYIYIYIYIDNQTSKRGRLYVAYLLGCDLIGALPH